MTTPLYMLRALQVGLTLSDLERLEYRDVIDIATEKDNDNYEYKELANQEDFDRF